MVRSATVSKGLDTGNAMTANEKVNRIGTPPNLATEVRLQRSARGCTSQPFRRAIRIVAAVVSADVGNVRLKARMLRHMRKRSALLSLLLLTMLNHGGNDLVQTALGLVTKAEVSLPQVRDSVLHILEPLAVSLGVRYITNGTVRTSGGNDFLGQRRNRNLFCASQVENFPHSSWRSYTCKNALDDIVNMPETARLLSRAKHG